MTTSDYIVSIPSMIFWLLSLFASIYICISVLMMKQVRKHRATVHNSNNSSLGSVDFSQVDNPNYWEKPQLIIHHIFWLSVCDTIMALSALTEWTEQIFEYDIFTKSPTMCYLSAIISQFSISSTIMWYFMIAWCLFTLIFNIMPQTEFQIVSKYQSFFVWFIVFIIVFIPIIFDKYGIDSNDSQFCWINDRSFYLILYIPVGFALIFALFLMICVWIRHCCNITNNELNNRISIQDKLIAQRLTMFTLGFILVWSWTVCERFYDVVSNNETPFWLTLVGHYTLGLNGCVNAYIWSKSHQFQSFVDSYQLLNEEKQQKEVRQLKMQIELGI